MHLRDGEVKWKMFHLFRSFGSDWTRWELREACFICEGLKYNDSRSTQIPVRSQQVSSHRESSKLRALSKAGGLYIAKDSLRPEKEGLRRGWAGLWGHRAEGCSGRAAGQQFGRSVQQQPAPPLPRPVAKGCMQPLPRACSSCSASRQRSHLEELSPLALLDSLSLSSCFTASYGFPNRTEDLYVCFVWKPALFFFFFYSLASSLPWSSVLFLFICFYLFLLSAE